MIIVIIAVTNTIVHHHNKSHPQIAGEPEASKDGQYRGEETKKTNQWFRTNLMLHSLILCERKKRKNGQCIDKETIVAIKLIKR